MRPHLVRIANPSQASKAPTSGVNGPFAHALSSCMAWLTHHPLLSRTVFIALALVLSGLVGWSASALFKSVDERSDDWTWNWKTVGPLERRLVVVDIDEKSVQALGPWPWKRETVADLVRAINAEGAGIKLFDIAFPDESEGDPALKAALTEGGPTVGGQIFSILPQTQVRSGVLSNPVDAGPCPSAALNAFGFVGNAPGLVSALGAVGHLTPIIDPDGAVRQVPAMVCFEGHAYPALSLAALSQMASIGALSPVPESRASQSNPSQPSPYRWLKGESWWQAPGSIQLINAPEFNLPVDDKGQIRVSYRQARSQFISLSASDVLAHRVPKGLLKGVMVLVGSTAFGSGDAIPTPHGGAEGGLEVHAQLITAALDQATPFMPRAAAVLQRILVALSLLLLTALSVWPNAQKRNKSLSSSDTSFPSTLQNLLDLSQWHQREKWVFLLPLAGLTLVAGCFGLHAYALLQWNCWVGWSMQAFVVGTACAFLTMGDLAVLRWQRSRMFQNLSTFLTDSVAQETALLPESSEVDVRERSLVVLALNVRNFDRFCDGNSSETTAFFLHDYFKTVHETLRLHGGELHHVSGAQVLAIWPTDDDQGIGQGEPSGLSGQHNTGPSYARLRDRRLKACESALQATQSLWQATQVWQDKPECVALELEMGLEAGAALMGPVGAKDRRFYALMGQTVMVAQALRDMVGDLSYPVLMGPGLVHALSEGNGSGGEKVKVNSWDVADQHPMPQPSGAPSTQSKILRLGEFLLPGTAQPRVVYAWGVNIDGGRLRVVSSVELEQRSA